MAADKTGGSAFPVFESKSSSAEYDCTSGGMTLRDYFAGQALKGIAYTQGKFTGWSKNVKENIEWDARLAYAYADAMIAERNKEE